MRVIQLRLRRAGHTNQVLAPAGDPQELRDLAAKGRRCAGRAAAVRAVAAAAVQHVVELRIGNRRRREERARKDGDPHYIAALHCSVAIPSTIAVEQLYTTLVVPKHQLMSLLRCGK